MTERATLSSAQIDRVLSIVEQLIGLIDCPVPGEPVIHDLEPHQARVERDPEDIKTAIRKRWGSVAAFERQYSLPALSVRGKKRKRYPAFWSDVQMRAAVVQFHRQMSVREAIERMMAEIGRAPSKSALARCWLWLDEVSGRAFHRDR